MTTNRRHTRDWSESERAEIHRLEKLCDASEHWTLECSHTDVGDPWCIIYDEEHHRTILHIARIDGQYVVVWPLKERSAKTALMAVAVQMAADGLTTYARDAGRS
jgi:hypothetical protein